jgi:large subunit ribosomal protein L18
MKKKLARIRRAGRSRSKIKDLGVHRLCIHRTPRHIYAQVITPDSASTVASASTVDKVLRMQVGYGGNINAAAAVGRAIAERSIAAGVTKVAFDRSGFKYHGRVKALAEAARESGLEF